MEKSLTDRDNQPETLEVKMRIFTHLNRPPSQNLLDRYAELYMSGFNQPPWDIYEYNYTVEKARVEFTRLVSTALDSGGALISLMCQGKLAGFSVVNSLGLFVRELKTVERYKRLPPKYKNPGRYFEKLSKLLKIPLNEFETIGYLADIVVDVRHRGKGFGKILVTSSLKYLKDDGKKNALAWTVNPVMAHTLSQVGFKRINGIGDQGEGIDFMVHNGEWYPTLSMPARRKTSHEGTAAVAQHYFKELYPSISL